MDCDVGHRFYLVTHVQKQASCCMPPTENTYSPLYVCLWSQLGPRGVLSASEAVCSGLAGAKPRSMQMEKRVSNSIFCTITSHI